MKISFAITVCNELNEIKKLLPFLNEHVSEEDEIVILFDEKNGDKLVINYLNEFKSTKVKIFQYFDFDNDFAKLKNTLTSYCEGDYIFQLDADETVSSNLIHNIKNIISENLETDLFYLSRINTVDGITSEHINKWKWNLDSNGRINFPDYQGRIHKKHLQWYGKVHERIVGAKYYALLPSEEDFCIIHNKTISKQEKQNNLYESI